MGEFGGGRSRAHSKHAELELTTVISTDKQSANTLPVRRKSSKFSPDGEKLPSVWRAVTDPSSGKTYYFNKSLNATQWVKPQPSSDAAEPFAAPKTPQSTKGTNARSNPLHGKPVVSKTNRATINVFSKTTVL